MNLYNNKKLTFSFLLRVCKVQQALMQNSHNGAFIGMTGTFEAINLSEKPENDIEQTQAIVPNQRTTQQQ